MSLADGPIAIGLGAVAAAAVAYAVVLPLLPGEKRAEQRRKALGATTASVVERATATNRREQVAKSLKELDAKKDSQRVTLELKLVRAGLDWSRQRFMVMSACAGVATALLVLLASGSPISAVGAGFAGAFGLPLWVLKRLQKRRMAQFVLELPNAIDVVVRGLRSGIPIADCLRTISREAKEPLRGEFRTAMESQAMGITIGDAILRMYERVPVTDVNFFAVVIGIQQKSGGNLSEALGNLSRVLRERKKMAAKVQAMSMEAKASAAIIASLPFVVAGITYLSSPDYVSLLWTTAMGKLFLAGAAFWMGCGIFAMKKMISFDI